MSAARNILITGSRGFLGRELINILNGARIIQLVRTMPDQIAPHEIIYTELDELVKQEHAVDIVFHLAAVVPYHQMDVATSAMHEAHVELPRQIIDRFPNARHVLASSISVYGNPPAKNINWNTPAHKPHAYGVSKASSEHILRDATSHAIVRFSSILGASMKKNTMVPKMIDDALRLKNLTVWGNGDRLQNYIDVRDAARLLLLCASASENIYTLGIGRCSYSNLDVAELIARNTGASISFVPGADESGYQYSDKETHQLIGFIPKFEIEVSIHDIIAAWTRSL